MKNTLLFLIFTYFSVGLKSQTVPCYFDSMRLHDTVASANAYNIQKSIRNSFSTNIFIKKINAKRSFTPVAKYIIPIVVHVVYSATNSLTNIPDSQIIHQIEILNQAMKDSGNGIQFCFATIKPDLSPFNGIMRYNTGNTIRAYKTPGGFGQLMTTYQFNPEKYFNIFIVPGIYENNNTRSDVSGVGIPSNMNPNHPGVVMCYDYFGAFAQCYTCNLDSSSDGKIMVHETGHFFGLYHTFEAG